MTSRPTASAPVDDPVHPDGIDWGSGGIETQFGWSIQAVYQGFVRTAQTAVADVPGGPRGYQVLVAITTEEPTSQLALAQRLGIDKTQMTYVIDALAEGGHVERQPHPRDRRIRQVVPTDAGRALLESARVSLHDVEEALMRDLAPDERTALRRLLARVALGLGEPAGPAAEHADAERLEQPVAAPHRSRRPARRTTPDGEPA
ncbi:MarR family winged helix-turn-helix transcriptional regulator [Clavibacter michiganensis]|uniref:MarR family transcriptional regulator n=1 Tax=Clavibacter michiganensis subsp. insidiosus TaxID=33014 RepID=A0A0D5CJC9_9MICO|nr:MarR family transcriptional regulator [Clavibacter michiganensis]AJW79362.1 MarR family transcriptional regulator [Clavibacter michiganensis subsp. insidiosus]AWF97900.1 MarR family transcriptional regulator [Clavibacter michiganensis subsp. insidiosus]